MSEWGKVVPVESLDTLPPADLIKIDVEGAEAKVIEGGMQSLRRKPTLLLEIHPLYEPDKEAMWASLKGARVHLEASGSQ